MGGAERGWRGTGDLWEFREVQIKDLTTPALHYASAGVYIYGAEKEPSGGGDDDAFWVVCERKSARQTNPTIGRDRDGKADIAPVPWVFTGPHIKSKADVPVPFDQTTSAVATLVSFSLPNYFSKGTNQNQLSVNMQTPQIP